MLLNFSNHPLISWSKKQISEAEKYFGEIIDIPFPNVNPNWNKEQIQKLKDKYFAIITAKLKNYNNQNNAVHIMGEHTFVFSLVNKLLENEIVCIASTTERIAKESNGTKTSEFKFVRFRKYNK